MGLTDIATRMGLTDIAIRHGTEDTEYVKDLSLRFGLYAFEPLAVERDSIYEIAAGVQDASNAMLQRRDIIDATVFAVV